MFRIMIIKWKVIIIELCFEKEYSLVYTDKELQFTQKQD